MMLLFLMLSLLLLMPYYVNDAIVIVDKYVDNAIDACVFVIVDVIIVDYVVFVNSIIVDDINVACVFVVDAIVFMMPLLSMMPLC